MGMKAEIKKRIEVIRRGEVPEGYKRTKVGIVPEEWEEGRLQNVLRLETRPVPKPDQPYWRLGLLSHAKGTFHELVENPETVQMKVLFQVKNKDLIVNITFAWEHAIALANETVGKNGTHRFAKALAGNLDHVEDAVTAMAIANAIRIRDAGAAEIIRRWQGDTDA